MARAGKRSDAQEREGFLQLLHALGLPTNSVMEEVTFRVLGPHERGRFFPDAWGFLLGLRQTGQLKEMELERVIEGALVQIDGPIALDDIREFMEVMGLYKAGDADGTKPTTIH
jgi:hypothetical protein